MAGKSPNEVVVRSVDEGFTQSIQIGAHQLAADEPVALGGDNEGPSPYELLMASLGACVSMTLRMYADRKGWPLEGVEVRLEHDKIYAKDCGDCETEKGRIDRIRKHITFRGPLTDEQRERLAEIAEKCPVQKTLNREVKIESVVAPPRV